MDEFRKGATRVLITTDVWARGLDVQQVGADLRGCKNLVVLETGRHHRPVGPRPRHAAGAHLY